MLVCKGEYSQHFSAIGPKPTPGNKAAMRPTPRKTNMETEKKHTQNEKEKRLKQTIHFLGFKF